ncbi:hypothetical protein PanWU01x14_221250 [Parasponia andersonii]|uniref:DUF8039 domain-containing protein n=1 Tax=Parasponia andersonii TaxID=3476 RepID=A0A2P5BPQ6_PARAD|nr:hypothetical protein PanWU01x14_221250 [Parasponia andersonii]
MQQMLKKQEKRFKEEIAKIQAGQQSNVGGSNTTPSRPKIQREEVQPQEIHINPIVAVGTSSLLKKRIGENNFRVSVEDVLDAVALTPIPNPDDDVRLVGDALGSHLAWPKMFVIFEDNLEFNDINRHQTGKNKSSQSQPPQTQEIAHP